jgi:hypothetical protein
VIPFRRHYDEAPAGFVILFRSGFFLPSPSAALPVSQMVGVPAPFKAPPEDVQAGTSAVKLDQQNL